MRYHVPYRYLPTYATIYGFLYSVRPDLEELHLLSVCAYFAFAYTTFINQHSFLQHLHSLAKLRVALSSEESEYIGICLAALEEILESDILKEYLEKNSVTSLQEPHQSLAHAPSVRASPQGTPCGQPISINTHREPRRVGTIEKRGVLLRNINKYSVPRCPAISILLV
jgi:hypothetical protein